MPQKYRPCILVAMRAAAAARECRIFLAIKLMQVVGARLLQSLLGNFF
jgi:hypothetical protein